MYSLCWLAAAAAAVNQNFQVEAVHHNNLKRGGSSFRILRKVSIDHIVLARLSGNDEPI
jgi:hypothetical protein